MTQETELQEQTPEQNAADFMAGFNAVMDPDSSESKAPEAVVEKVETPEQEETDAAQPETPEAPEEEMFLGMSASQIKTLLEKAAKVDQIEEQLRKAHGKIGELNSHIHQPKSAPTQSDAPAVNDEDLTQWERDFPEVAALVEAKLRRLQPMAPEAQTTTTGLTPTDVAMQVLDVTHDGWRETISSQDFSLWIATQDQDTQETFSTTANAKAMGKILSSFDSWKTKVADRGAKSRARLEEAIVPTGNGAKVVTAPTEQDAFLAGFNAVRAQYQ